MVVKTTTIRVRVLEHNEDWKPEIEHIKGSDLLKKKKKKKVDLPPHLRLDAMKKAFAHTNESLKDELISTASKKHAEAKKKKFKDFTAQAKDAKKRIRFYDKKGSGYIKDGKKKYD